MAQRLKAVQFPEPTWLTAGSPVLGGPASSSSLCRQQVVHTARTHTQPFTRVHVAAAGEARALNYCTLLCVWRAESSSLIFFFFFTDRFLASLK